MELLVLLGLAAAVFGGICIAWVLSQSDTKAAPTPSATADEAPAEAEASQPQPAEMRVEAEPEPPQPQPIDTQSPPPADRPPINSSPSPDSLPLVDESSMPRYVAPRRDELAIPRTALQLNAIAVINEQIEHLQAEYIRLDAERERLAQELLTSYLIEKIEGSAGRLKAETKKEAQGLRQQLVKVSSEFERAQFRLASLEHLQERLDDPRVARHIEQIVLVVKQLAGER
jgi:hypothetical protein